MAMKIEVLVDAFVSIGFHRQVIGLMWYEECFI